jgi:hypothetical protein
MFKVKYMAQNDSETPFGAGIETGIYRGPYLRIGYPFTFLNDIVNELRVEVNYTLIATPLHTPNSYLITSRVVSTIS